MGVRSFRLVTKNTGFYPEKGRLGGWPVLITLVTRLRQGVMGAIRGQNAPIFSFVAGNLSPCATECRIADGRNLDNCVSLVGGPPRSVHARVWMTAYTENRA